METGLSPDYPSTKYQQWKQSWLIGAHRVLVRMLEALITKNIAKGYESKPHLRDEPTGAVAQRRG